MWGLSGLKTLNLGHNKLTNVIDQNFDGACHQYELAILAVKHHLLNDTFIVKYYFYILQGYTL